MFGKTQRGVSERSTKPKQPLIPKWLGTLVAILAVLCLAVILMLWKPWEPVKPKTRLPPSTTRKKPTRITVSMTCCHNSRLHQFLNRLFLRPLKDTAPVVIVEAPEPVQPATPADAVPADGSLDVTEAPVPRQPSFICRYAVFQILTVLMHAVPKLS